MSDSETSDEMVSGGEESSSFTGALPRTISLSAAKFTNASQQESAPPGFDEHRINGTAERPEGLNGDGGHAEGPAEVPDVRMSPAEDDRMSATEEGVADDAVQEEEAIQEEDEPMVPASPTPARASPNRYRIDDKTMQTLLDLTEQFRQQRVTWCSTLPLPNNVLVATLDQISDIIRNGYDVPGSEADGQVLMVLGSVMVPVFEKICYEDTGASGDDHKNVMSCVFRYLVIFVNKLSKCVVSGKLPLVYWTIFKMVTEYNNRFFTRVSPFPMSSITPIVPGDLTLPSPIIRKNPQVQGHQWFVSSIIWFHKLRGFDTLISYFHAHVDGNSTYEEIVPYLDVIQGYIPFLSAKFIRSTLEPIIDLVMVKLEGVTESDWTKQSFSEFRDCLSFKMALFVRMYLHFGHTAEDREEDYFKAKKAAQLKLLFLKKCVIVGAFAAKMCAMDELCRMLQSEDETLDMNSADLEDWIRQIELVETLFKDNLHHMAYIERLHRAVRILLDRGLLHESFLDVIWQAQQGKHDVIQRNMQLIIAKMVVVFNGELLDAFWIKMTESWDTGSFKEKETLVDLMRRVGLENFIDNTAVNFDQVEHVLKILWEWSREGFDGLRGKIYEVIIDVLQETVNSSKGLVVLQNMCHLVAQCAVTSNDPVGNGDDPTGLCLNLLKRILELFTEGDIRYGAYSNKRSQMLGHLDLEHQTDEYRTADFAFGKLIVEGICVFVDSINFESPESSIISDSSMETDCSSIDSSAIENASIMLLIAALQTRLEFVEFLLQIVQHSNNLEASPFEDEWAKTLWNKLINPKQPQKLQNVGFGFFAGIISWMDVMDHSGPFIEFFREEVMAVEPATLSMKGFQCFESFLRVANVLLDKMKSVTVMNDGGHEERDFYLMDSDFEGEEYLRKAIVLGGDKVFLMASRLLVKLWAIPTQESNEEQKQFVAQVISKFTTWLSEVEADGADVSKSTRDSRIRRVLQTINEVVDKNDAEIRTIHRKYPTVRRAIVGKGIKINVMFKIEDMQMLFSPRVPLRTNAPLTLIVHENLRVYDLVKLVCEFITNQGGGITPYAMMLVRKGGGAPGGSNRFTVSDWHLTVKDLQVDEQTIIVARPDKSRIGNDGRNNEIFMRQTSVECCHELEQKVYACQLINDEELLNRIIALGNDCELIEACTRLFCSIPMAKIGDFDRAEPWQAKVQRFRKFLAQLTAERSGSKKLCGVLQLYQTLLPASLPYTLNSDTVTSFFAAGGPTALIKMFSQYADMECLDELAVLNCDLLLRILPQIVYLFISVIENRLDARISNAALDFFPAAKRHADVFIQDLARKVILPQNDDLLNEMIMDVSEKDLFAFLHIGLKFMHDTARTSVLGQLLDGPIDAEALMDPLVEEPDKMVGACIYVFSVLCSYSDGGYNVLGSADFHNFLLECCSEEEQSSELQNLIPDLLCEVEKDRESTALLEASIAFLFEHLDTQNSLFWEVLCNLIEKFSELAEGAQLPNLAAHVEEMVAWLNDVQKQTEETMCHYPAQHLLVGRLRLASTLFSQLGSKEKFELGVGEGGSQLVERLLYNFLIPSSRAFAQKLWQEGASRIVRSQTAMETLQAPTEMDFLAAVPRSTSTCAMPISTVSVCKTEEAMKAGYDVLRILCENPECLAQLVKIINELFYTDRNLDDVSWDYQPDYSLRQPDNFVGLKNGGATCYMNSILQQLYMLNQTRDTILNAPIDENKEDQPYEIGVVEALQSVFAHLAGSELEAYTPDEFWRIFKLNERIVNVHEQQDAFEFFNTVGDLIDGGMEKLGCPKIISETFGGLFADEKICKDCPHKFSREEAFTSISIDVRSHNNIVDSLHEFVKGDVLENDNAYHCETCNKKVRAVKRLSIKKLPTNLVVQLKRFEFDWEKNEPVKFNDYFEFPFTLDMRPYTAEALNSVDEAEESPASPTPLDSDCQYNLRGVVVHSGQATGGHYFSYIRNDDGKWFKFDDNDVSPYACEQRDVRYKWYGDDPNSVDLNGRRRGRVWWNAFLLFYEKVNPTALVDRNLATLLPSLQTPLIPVNAPLSVDPVLAQTVVDASRRSSTASPVTRLHKRFSTLSLMSNRLRNIPPRLEKQVRSQNTRIMHERNQYNGNFFGFIAALVKHHLITEANTRNEGVYLLLTELYSNFLIYTCLHASMALRKEPDYDGYQLYSVDSFRIDRVDWCEAVLELVRWKSSRVWFINNVMLSEAATRTYCIAAKDLEVRGHYARMIARVLEKVFIEGDTIGDLLQFKSPHLNRVLQPKYTKNLLVPAIQLLADTLAALIKSFDKVEKTMDMYNILINLAMLIPAPVGIFVHFARAGLISNLLRVMDVGSVPYVHLHVFHVKLCSLMFRTVNIQQGPQGTKNPFLLIPEESALSLHDLADGKQVAKELASWADETTHMKMLDFLISHTWDQADCEWMKRAFCFFCWSNRELTNRMLNLAIRLILQDRHSAQVESGLQILHALCYMTDDSVFNGRTWQYLFNEVPFIHANDQFERRDFSAGISGLYGMRSIVYINNQHKRDTFMRALIIVLEANEEHAIQHIKQQDLERFEEIIDVTEVEHIDNNVEGVTCAIIPNIRFARIRLHRFLTRFRESGPPTTDESMESEDVSEESEGEMDQPLDLTLAPRSSATTPQAAEKRTLPIQDDTDSLNGEGEAKKLRIIGAAVDDEQLLTTTSISATDLQEQNSQNPPPGYSET